MAASSRSGSDSSDSGHAHALFSIYHHCEARKLAKRLGVQIPKGAEADGHRLATPHRILPLDEAVKTLLEGEAPAEFLRFAMMVLVRSAPGHKGRLKGHVHAMAHKLDGLEKGVAAAPKARARDRGKVADLVDKHPGDAGTRTRARQAFSKIWRGKKLGTYDTETVFAPLERKR